MPIAFTEILIELAIIIVLFILICISIAKALSNIRMSMTRDKRVYDLAKLQLILAIAIPDILIRYIVVFGLNDIIKQYAFTYVPYPQHPMPIVNADKNNCYDIDLEGVTEEGGNK